MKNLWNSDLASNFTSDIEQRVYTSNLLGQSDRLVLHGGGNTSVKSTVDGDEILFVKGSGWDLVNIKAEGFAPVNLNVLKNMAKLEFLSDSEMVRLQKDAMINKTAPNPSVEAILHAIIPYKFVDHTHADAVVTISNSKNGKYLIKKLFPNFLIIPYIMPGFILASKIYELTKDFDWEKCEGIILHNHGIFTFDNDAKTSYDKMIKYVNQAEEFLDKEASLSMLNINNNQKEFDVDILIKLISIEKEFDIAYTINNSELALSYSSLKVEKLTRGVLTPEHIIRTKRSPLYLIANDDLDDMKIALKKYIKEYVEYFDAYSTSETMLNPAPNYIVVKDFGVISVGKTQKEALIVNDVVSHTIEAVLRADMLGGYESISLKDSFDMEYWELEQVKLKK